MVIIDKPCLVQMRVRVGVVLLTGNIIEFLKIANSVCVLKATGQTLQLLNS